MDILERYNNNETLLLTLGDSWTFGDSLGGHDRCFLEYTWEGKNYRKKHLWGRHLADSISADWINLSKAGISNSVIVDYLDYFKNTYKYKNYKQIFVVIVLTETGRELQQLDWKAHKKVLQTSEQKIYNAIENHVEKKMSFTVARNFTVNYKRTRVPRNINFVEKNWQTVLFEHENITPVNVTGPASGVAIGTYENYNPGVVNNSDYKQFLIDTVDSAQPLWDAIDKCDLNYKRLTKHPTEQGHRIWADYLYNNYFQNN